MIGKLRFCVIIVSIFPIIISAVFSGLYWNMWAQALELNDEAAEVYNYNGSVSYYDTCALESRYVLAVDAGLDADTKWTVLLSFNSILYLLLAICSVCQIIGTWAWPLCCLAGFGHCFGDCARLACLIVTGVFRFSGDGDRCAKNDVGAGQSDWTFKEHGETIEALFISQCVLHIGYSICIYCAMQVGSGITGT